MTQETMDMLSRGLVVELEGGSDPVRPSPSSSSNGDDFNPFQVPEDNGSELIPMKIDEEFLQNTHTTLGGLRGLWALPLATSGNYAW